MYTEKRTLLILVLVLLPIFDLRTCTAQLSGADGDTALKTEQAEIKQIAAEIVANRKAVLNYRPNWEQCRALVGSRSDAIRLYTECTAVYRGIVRDGGLVFPKEITEFEVEQNQLKKLAGDKADIFNDLPLYELAYPEQGKRTFISCFLKVNGQWAYFPQPWLGLEAPAADLPGPHLLWIRMLHSEQYEDAYQFAAPILRKAYPFEKFKRYMQTLDLKDLEDLTFTMQARERRNSETAYIREGNLVFADGSRAKLKLVGVFIKGEGAMPFQISMDRTYGAATNVAFVPPVAKCEQFSRLFVQEIAKSIEQGDFSKFHEQHASYDLKKKVNPEDFKAAFSGYSDTDFSFLENATFSIAGLPRFQNSYGGCVEFDGSFRDAKTKQVLGFFLSASGSSSNWKVNGISFYPVRKYDPDATIPDLSTEDFTTIAASTNEKFVKGVQSGTFDSLLNSMAAEVRGELSGNALKGTFAFLPPLFEDENKLGDPDKLKLKILSTQLDIDHLKMNVSLTNESNSNWLSGKLEYWFRDGDWKLIKINYKY